MELHKWLMFISLWQLALLANSDHWYVDGTFSSVPNNFYQLINISIYDTLSNMHIPLLWALATHKSCDMYMHLFWDLAKLLPNVKQLRIRTDFESKLMAVLELIFDSEICGCLFHFAECLRRKAQKLGLMNTTNEQESNEVILTLKTFCFRDTSFEKELSDLRRNFVNAEEKLNKQEPKDKSSVIKYYEGFYYYVVL